MKNFWGRVRRMEKKVKAQMEKIAKAIFANAKPPDPTIRKNG